MVFVCLLDWRRRRFDLQIGPTVVHSSISEQAICMQSVANANKIKQLALPLLDTSPQANPSFFVCTRFPLQFQSYHHPYQDTGENTHHFDVIKGRVSEDKCFLPPTTFYVNSKKEKETYHSSSSCLGKEGERHDGTFIII